MRKRIGYQYGVLYDGWVGQIKKWYGWSTVIEFDSESEAIKWFKK